MKTATSLFFIFTLLLATALAISYTEALTAFLSGQLSASNSWASSTNKVTFTLEVTVSTDRYAAIAVADTSSSNIAKGVACKMPQTSSGSATCVGISTGSVLGTFSSRTDASVSVVSSTVVNGNKARVEVSVTASNINLANTARKRIVVVIGEWDNTNNQPKTQIITSNRGTSEMDFNKEGNGAGKIELTALFFGLVVAVVMAVLF